MSGAYLVSVCMRMAYYAIMATTYFEQLGHSLGEGLNFFCNIMVR